MDEITKHRISTWETNVFLFLNQFLKNVTMIIPQDLSAFCTYDDRGPFYLMKEPF